MAALTIDHAANASSPYSEVMRALVIDKLTGPLGYAPGATVGTMLTQSKLSLYEPAFAQQYFPGVPTQQSKSAATSKALDLRQLWTQGQEGFQLWREIEGRQKDLGAYARNPSTPDDQRRATEQFMRHQKELNTARTIGNGLASLIDLKDKKLGQEVRVTVNATATILEALDKYNLTKTMIAASTAANWVKLGLNAVAGGIMTAGLIGAAIQVVALFKRQSAPADPVLEQLKLLRQEIHQLRQEMHERFDRIDAKLDTIMEKLDQAFVRIDLDLGIIKDDLATIYNELWDVYSALNRLDSRFYQWVDTGFRRPLLENINGCLDYRQTHTGESLPYQGSTTSYVECENLFHSWATIHASDALQAGTVRDAGAYSDDRMYDEINCQGSPHRERLRLTTS